MTRGQLEHLIRAATQIADDSELVIIGSQAVLGSWPDAPAEILISVKADVFPKNKPERAGLIDGTIGELSPFHNTFGYYAHGISEKSATLPRGWRQRLVPIRNANPLDATGWCLELHDLVISKLVAGRPKDLEFAQVVNRYRRLRIAVLAKRLRETDLADERLRETVAGRIQRLASPPAEQG